MQEDHQSTATEVTQEIRLVETLLTQKPNEKSWLVALGTIAIMALTTKIYWHNVFEWSEFLPAIHQNIFQEGEWWRVLSAVFIHSDLGHFLSNMYMLGIFSFLTYGYFGFRAYPLLTVASAAVVNVIAVWTYAPEVRLLGASGLVYLLGGFWLMLYYLIQKQYSKVKRLFRVTGIGLLIFFPSTFVPTTSYRTHAIGFLLGIIVGWFFYQHEEERIVSFNRYLIINENPPEQPNI